MVAVTLEGIETVVIHNSQKFYNWYKNSYVTKIAQTHYNSWESKWIIDSRKHCAYKNIKQINT